MNINPTHYGTMFGVPVYIDMTDPECPGIEVQKKWMEPLLDVMEFLFGCFVYINTLFDRDYEPMYPIYIKGAYKQ